MPQGTKICKICGKEYPYCKTFRGDDTFRYQDVACCPEHARQYFKKIAISRGELVEEPKTSEETPETTPKKAAPKKAKETAKA